jgi:CubicO group peptidase (beta-lactamase class C family)
MQELNIPGLAVVAVRGNEIVLLETFGVCDPAGKQRVTPHSPFYLASVTKSFTALGVALLAEEGKLNLDDTVKKYLPRFTLADKKLAESVTVRDLLCHRHGLNSDPIAMAEAYFGNITDDRYYALLEFVESPGKFAYSNLHYTLAGRVIEAVSGKRWQDFLAERVFAPLEMHDATCYASKLYANPQAAWPIVEVDGNWQVAPLVKSDAVMHAAGGMGASALDMANWLRFQLTGTTPSGSELLSPTLLRDTQTQQVGDLAAGTGPPAHKRSGYSLGWFTGKLAEHRYLNHGGGYLGTSTYVSILPDEGVGVAVLMNEGPPNSLFPYVVANDVYSKLLGEELPDVLPDARRLAARSREQTAQRTKPDWNGFAAGAGLTQPAERYAGHFENNLWGDLVISAERGGLKFRVGDLTLRGHGLAKDKFRLEVPGGDIIEGKFLFDEQQQLRGLVLQTPEGDAEFRKLL